MARLRGALWLPLKKVALFLLLVRAVCVCSAEWKPSDGLILTGDIVTMDGQLTVIPDGQVVLQNEKIVAVLRNGEALPTNIQLPNPKRLSTGGYIFPGLIDAHNHLEYNMIPLWKVAKKYNNRYEWTSPKAYKTQISLPKTLLTDKHNLDLDAEVIKYAEIKAILGGVTSIQGSPNLQATKLLVRNLENPNFGRDRIFQHGLSIDDARFQKGLENGLLKQIDQQQVDAWLIHLAEGVDTKSRNEFGTLKRLRLLRDVTVVIHGTALQLADFQEMAQAGAKLVWSPLSNLLLYGQTTDIPKALSAGLVICLGSDWSPSGSKNLLTEIKIAHEYDKAMWGHVITDVELVKMVTSNPAFALGWDDKVGQIKVGYYADLAIFRKGAADPYRTLIQATERDVRLVLVGGVPDYGDLDLMQEIKPGDFEILDVQGTQKAIDVTAPDVPLGQEKLSTIENLLAKGLLDDPVTLKQKFGSGMTDDQFNQFMDKTFPGIQPVALDTLLPDAAFFESLRKSTNAHLPFDIATYWASGGQSQVNPDLDTRVLALVNNAQTTVNLLVQAVGINSRAANSIINHRNGPDHVSGTADDALFSSVSDLDDVPLVGASTLSILRSYATTH